jgi:hypothetical protein
MSVAAAHFTALLFTPKFNKNGRHICPVKRLAGATSSSKARCVISAGERVRYRSRLSALRIWTLLVRGRERSRFNALGCVSTQGCGSSQPDLSSCHRKSISCKASAVTKKRKTKMNSEYIQSAQTFSERDTTTISSSIPFAYVETSHEQCGVRSARHTSPARG